MLSLFANLNLESVIQGLMAISALYSVKLLLEEGPHLRGIF